MDLRTGRSYWQAVGPQPTPAVSLYEDLRCDVCILGGGITGALVAERLTREGVDTVMLDRRDLGVGSTAASTGLLQYEVDTPLVELIAQIGERNALHAYRRGLQAIDEIEAICSTLNIDCRFRRRDSLYFAGHWWHGSDVRKEYECRKAHGFDVELLEHDRLAEISSIHAACAIRSRGDAEIDPFRFTGALLDKARERGLRAFAKTPAIDVVERPDDVLVITDRHTVRCKHLVIATGYESKPYLPDNTGDLQSTYAVTSKPMPCPAGWPDECLLWESSRPYFYARRTPEGCCMIGGEDTGGPLDHALNGELETKVAKLVARFHELFPDTEFVPDCAWAGTFGESADGLAYIGSPPGRPYVSFAVGYGGNGITFSMIAAGIIADAYLGRENPDAEIFRFGR